MRENVQNRANVDAKVIYLIVRWEGSGVSVWVKLGCKWNGKNIGALMTILKSLYMVLLVKKITLSTSMAVLSKRN